MRFEHRDVAYELPAWWRVLQTKHCHGVQAGITAVMHPVQVEIGPRPYALSITGAVHGNFAVPNLQETRQ